MTELSGYKVVARHSSGLVSANHFGYGRVLYRPRRPTIPKTDCGPLAVFETIDQAMTFLPDCYFNTVEIWACRYVPSTGDRLWVPWLGPIHPNQPNGTTLLSSCPPGTRLADSVLIVSCERQS